MKKMTLTQMEQTQGNWGACDVAAYVSGASFTFVLQAVGTAICPGIGNLVGWGLGAWASLTIGDACE